MTDRKRKIQELKENLNKTNQQVVGVITAAATEEEKAALPEKLALLKATRIALTEEIKILRLNKTGSTFFEYHPHKGMNRTQARNFRRSNRPKKTNG